MSLTADAGFYAAIVAATAQERATQDRAKAALRLAEYIRQLNDIVNWPAGAQDLAADASALAEQVLAGAGWGDLDGEVERSGDGHTSPIQPGTVREGFQIDRNGWQLDVTKATAHVGAAA